MPRFIDLKSIAALLLMATASQAAENRWRLLSSGRWELYTDAGEQAGAAILLQLLEMQAVFAQVALKLPESAPPVRVVVYRNDQDFKLLRRHAGTRGLFQSSRERDYILLLQTGEETARAARHEYVHLVMHHTTGPMPAWLEEGLAEYFSTLRQRSGRVMVGEPIRTHQRTLASADWLKPNQMMSLRTDSPSMAEPGQAPLFYAQSWGLTHLLMQAPDAAARVQRFGEFQGNGVEQSTAFRLAFGRTMEAALGELSSAVATELFPAAEAPMHAPAGLATRNSREVSEVESRVLRADVLLAAGRQAEALQMVKDSARQWPNEPAAVAALGYLAMRQADYAAARNYLEQAVKLGDRQASTFFELAMLTRDTGGAESVVVEHLTHAVELSPSFGEAWYLLGTSKLRTGRAGEAVACLSQATRILPRQSLFWEALARAYQASGKREAARSAAQHAVTYGTSLEQISMAQGLLRELDSAPQPPPVSQPAVKTPKTWEQRKGDSRVSGNLVMVDCGGSALRFHVQAPASGPGAQPVKTILTTENPNQIMLSGKTGQKREFICGAQNPAPLVEATYIAAPAPVAAASPEPAPKPAPAKGRRPAAPVKRKPADPPVAGELITMEFK